MNDMHAMPITNITHDACRDTVDLGVSAKYFTHFTPDNNHTAYMHICLHVYKKFLAETDATIVINACNHHQCWKSKWCNHRQGHIFLFPLLHRMGIKWRRRSTTTILKLKSKIQMHPWRIVWVIQVAQSENILLRFLHRGHDDDACSCNHRAVPPSV